MDTANKAVGVLAVRQSKCEVRITAAPCLLLLQCQQMLTFVRAANCRFYENSQPAVKALYGRHTQQNK